MLTKIVVELIAIARAELRSSLVASIFVPAVWIAAGIIASLGSIGFAQGAKTAYGNFEIPAQVNPRAARPVSGASVNRGAAAQYSVLGSPSTPSSASTFKGGQLSSVATNYRNTNPGQSLGQKPINRTSDRLGRGRVTTVGFQENIDTGESAETNELPPSNPVPDVSSADDGLMSDMSYGQGAMHHDSSMMVYGEQGDVVYCDGCGDISCGCGLRTHGSGSLNECRLRLGVGALGFNNAMNYAGAGTNLWSGDGSGSFGFQQSLQWSTPVPGLFYGEMGAQVGVRTVQANLAGAEFTADGRNQLYLTAGLFRRADYGLQGGLVLDYLAERWYLNTDLVQLRGELSYMFEPNHEFGFRFTSSMQSSSSGGFILNDAGSLVSTSGTFAALDQYRLFTRHVLDQEHASYLELSAGWSDEKHGIVGAMIETVLSSQINLQSSFTMGIPGDAVSEGDHQQEQWQVGLMLVWTPSRPCISGLQDYYRPLFEVADPGSFWLGRGK